MFTSRHRLPILTLATTILSFAFARAGDTPGDQVATPPLIRGFVAGLAVDADGNRYVTGSFYDAQDFNPAAGADIKTPVGWSDLFVTRFNADGSYAWTQNVGVANGSTIGAGIVAANGTVYATGGQFTWDDKTSTSTQSALVVALDAATGKLKDGFGTAGIAIYSGANGATSLALAVADNVVYATGVQYPDWSQYWTADGVPNVISLPPTVQPRNTAFVWALDAGTGAVVSAFGTNGVVALSDVKGDNTGRSIVVADGWVFVAGSLFDYDWGQVYADSGKLVPELMGLSSPNNDPSTGSTSPGAGGGDASFVPYYYGVQNAFVASLDALTGALNPVFASGGIKQFGGADAVSGNGLAVSGEVVYLTGGYTKLPPPPATADQPSTTTSMSTDFQPNSDIYVLAFAAKSGVEMPGFGANGLTTFGRQFNDEGVALAVSAGTVYVTGSYGNRTVLGGNFYPLASDGGIVPPPVPNTGGPPKPLNGVSTSGKSGGTSSMGANGPSVDAFGVPNKIGADPGAAAINSLRPIWWPYGGGISDAFVLALDADSGAPRTTFSGDGLQTFGGSGSDGGVGIAVFGDNVVLAGFVFSTDAGIGGLGAIDATDWYAFLLTLDTATGGGGGAEVNTAPVVRTGDPQTVRLPQHKGGDYNEYQAWLFPTVIDDGLPNPPGTLTVKWSKDSGPGTVKFDDDSQAFTAVSFSAPGTYVLRLDASDSVLSASGTTTVTVVQNQVPVIDSAPTATPNPAATGQDISFTAAAHDPDGDGGWLYYWWDFGDDCYGWDASTTHAYLAPGSYSVTLHVEDGVDETTAKFKVEVTGDPIFNIDDLQFTVDFAGKKRSGLRVRGSVGGLSKKFDPSGTVVNLNAGGATGSFTLDKKGRGKNVLGTFTLRRTARGWKYTAKLDSAAIDTGNMPAGATNTLGLSNTSVKKQVASVPITLNIGGLNYSGNKTVEYSIEKDMAKGK